MPFRTGFAPAVHPTPWLCVVLAICGCSSDAKPKRERPTAEPESVVPSRVAPQATLLPAGPRRIERIKLPSIKRKGLDGTTRDWTSLEESQVTDIEYRELYQSRGEAFVGFKGTIAGGTENCLVYWKAEFLQSTTGRGPSLTKLESTVPVRAGEAVVASGIVNLSPKIASQAGSANVGYWKLCGDDLPSPNEFDIRIAESEAEQIRFGKTFDLHHTRVALESKGDATTTSPKRCTFEIVVEDVDQGGYTLNRDFASFSMAPGTTSSAKIRRTTFEGGNENDYEALAIGKRSYLRRLSCIGPWDPKTADVEGLTVNHLELVPRVGPPSKAEHFVRATFGHSATLKNTTGEDCSFRVRYRILDKAGVPMNRAPILSESLHLRKGATAKHDSETERLFVWQSQADEVGSLVVEQAAPIQGCERFDEGRAL